MKIGTFDIIYTSSSNVNYSGTITKDGRIERLERIDDEIVPSSEYTEVWANYFEAEGKLVYATTQDFTATESWNITDGLDIDTTPWGNMLIEEDDGSVTVVESEYQDKITKIVIKDELYPKTTDYMFDNLYNVTNIEGLNKVLDNITDIGESMFSSCGGLGNLDLSTKNITNIREGAFSCSGLTRISLPNTLKTIKENVFESCDLESIDIPEGVTSIEENAFGSCWKLEEVNFPDSLITIGNYAFWGTSLNSITIPENVSFIGHSCFEKCEYLTTVNYNAIDASGSDFINEYDGKYYSPFYDCPDLENVNIGPNVRVIPDRLFFDDEAGCGVTNISFALATNLEKIGQFAFATCKNVPELDFSGATNLKIIEADSFHGCFNLENVEIPEGVIKLGYAAFAWCINLEEITLPSTLTFVGENAFDNCTALTTIYIPNGTINGITDGGGTPPWGAPNAEIVYINN